VQTTDQFPAETNNQRISERVERDLGSTRFDRFFRPSVGFRCVDGRLEVEAPTAFEAELLSKRFAGEIRAAAEEELGDGCEVLFRVSSEEAAPETGGDECGTDPADEGASARRAANRGPTWAQPPRGPERNGSRRRGGGSMIRLRHRLDEFVVGATNELAYHAASRIASEDCPAGFSPLFLHGDCGVGKTHLLQGIAGKFLEGHPGARVRYATGESFTNDYITAVRERRLDSFRARHRDLDLLCIDDVHFLSNKKSTQKEFLFTFDAIGQVGARVALASDEHPTQIAEFSRELRSRFLSGMVVELKAPDQPTRMEIARRLAGRRGLAMEHAALAALAARCAESVREIEGALTRLEILRQISGRSGAITAVEVNQGLGPASTSRPTKPIQFDQIAEVVCESLRTPMSDLLGKGRHKRVVLARGLAAHLARELTTLSYPEIARAMNRPNHSTAITADQRIKKRIESGEMCNVGPDLEGVSVADLSMRLSNEVVRLAGG